LARSCYEYMYMSCFYVLVKYCDQYDNTEIYYNLHFSFNRLTFHWANPD